MAGKLDFPFVVIDTAQGGKRVRHGMYWSWQTREQAQAIAAKLNKPNDPNRYRATQK